MPAARQKEDILRERYLRASKIILAVALIYFFIVVFNIVRVFYLGFYKRVFFTLNQWISSGIVILGILIALEGIFILHYQMVKRKRIASEKPKSLYLRGKKLHVYTLPEGSKGGVFSKTYVKIDEENILTLRYQMIMPEELWGETK